MGLDIVLYKKGKQAGVTEIRESLHKALFKNSAALVDLEYLTKLSDYYKTNIWLNSTEIEKLVREMKQLSNYLSEHQIEDIRSIINLLSDSSVDRVHIAGD